MKKIYFLTAILLVTLLAACQTQVTATQAPPESTSAPEPTDTATPVPTGVPPSSCASTMALFLAKLYSEKPTAGMTPAQ